MRNSEPNDFPVARWPHCHTWTRAGALSNHWQQCYPCKHRLSLPSHLQPLSLERYLWWWTTVSLSSRPHLSRQKPVWLVMCESLVLNFSSSGAKHWERFLRQIIYRLKRIYTAGMCHEQLKVMFCFPPGLIWSYCMSQTSLDFKPVKLRPWRRGVISLFITPLNPPLKRCNLIDSGDTLHTVCIVCASYSVNSYKQIQVNT